MNSLNNAKILFPKRNSTLCTSIEELATEQLAYFAIDPNSVYGEMLKKAVLDIYAAQSDISKLKEITNDTVGKLDAGEKVAYFNAKRFMSFQIAKVLETLQTLLKQTYESLGQSDATLLAKL
ncbi:MAG: hypothetical protein HRT71_03230 [Flavobacteriales bacterium]|nr:hypothetical protein [Flavobacteriales bacterium]